MTNGDDLMLKIRIASVDFKRPAVILRNEQGMALIIALSLLAIMSVLGAMLLSSSSTEILLSRNAQNGQQAFYVADRALAYGKLTMPDGDTPINLYTDRDTTVSPSVLHRDRIDMGAGGLGDPDADPPECMSAECNTVAKLSTSGAPTGSGFDTTYRVTNYLVTTEGLYPADSDNPSRTALQAQVSTCCFKETSSD